MIRTNIDKLVKMSVVGEISHPKTSPYTITADGRPVVRPDTGGITYNIRVGDQIADWVVDHVEPGVSIKNSDSGANSGLNTLTCIGNEALVTDGEAKGEKGTVTGKHGGIEHILVDFPPETLDKLNIGDKMLIKAFGVGLELPDFPEVTVINVSPKLFEAMKLSSENDSLVVQVTHKIPARIMGSGIGSNQAYRGDYDIQMFDDATVEEYGLDTLRFGDIVAIIDADTTYGRIYKQGAITIGSISHSNCVSAGHGPGVTSLFTSTTGKIIPQIDSNANLANILKLRDAI